MFLQQANNAFTPKMARAPLAMGQAPKQQQQPQSNSLLRGVLRGPAQAQPQKMPSLAPKVPQPKNPTQAKSPVAAALPNGQPYYDPGQQPTPQPTQPNTPTPTPTPTPTQPNIMDILGNLPVGTPPENPFQAQPIFNLNAPNQTGTATPVQPNVPTSLYTPPPAPETPPQRFGPNGEPIPESLYQQLVGLLGIDWFNGGLGR